MKTHKNNSKVLGMVAGLAAGAAVGAAVGCTVNAMTESKKPCLKTNTLYSF